AVAAEGVDIGVAEPRPVPELDAELERRLRLADELVLVETEEAVKKLHRRDRGLADADCADLGRFYETDAFERAVAHARERGRGHPSRGAAADDDDRAYRALRRHAAPICARNVR